MKKLLIATAVSTLLLSSQALAGADEDRDGGSGADQAAGTGSQQNGDIGVSTEIDPGEDPGTEYGRPRIYERTQINPDKFTSREQGRDMDNSTSKTSSTHEHGTTGQDRGY